MQRGINASQRRFVSAIITSSLAAADFNIMTHGLGEFLINMCVRRMSSTE